jgi:hypothetical protein
LNVTDTEVGDDVVAKPVMEYIATEA